MNIVTRMLTCAAVFSLCVLLFTSCAGMGNGIIKSPGLRVTDIGVRDIRLSRQDIQLELEITNPNPVPIPVRGFSYRLDINGVEFASGFNRSRVDIPASEKTALGLLITGDLVNFILQNRLTGSDVVDYTLSGDISVLSSSLKFPYSYRGEIDLPGYIEQLLYHY